MDLDVLTIIKYDSSRDWYIIWQLSKNKSPCPR